jgi:hypothetical protein
LKRHKKNNKSIAGIFQPIFRQFCREYSKFLLLLNTSFCQIQAAMEAVSKVFFVSASNTSCPDKLPYYRKYNEKWNKNIWRLKPNPQRNNQRNRGVNQEKPHKRKLFVFSAPHSERNIYQKSGQ